MDSWIVLTPAVLAIVLALRFKQVYLALFAGMWLGATILAEWNPILGLNNTLEYMVGVFSDPGSVRTILFCILVGGLIALVQASGGVLGFINWAQSKGWGTTKRGAEMLAMIIGMVIFVESSITSLVVGAVSRPFFDKLNIAREKLAFYCDTTSAAVCMMIPLNGWGAFVLGLLAAIGYEEDGVSVLIEGLAYNFYSWFSILFAFGLAYTGKSWGAMRRAEERASTTGEVIRKGAQAMVADEIADLAPAGGQKAYASNLIVPILTMVLMIFAGLYITGEGNMMKGSGSTAVLWAVCAGIGVAIIMYAIPREGKSVFSITESVDLVLKGSSGLLPVTVLIVFAFALGQISRDLNMAEYIIGLMPVGAGGWWLPAVIFVLGCFVSFTLGSSWTAFAILIPIALPVASGLGMPVGLALGALLSGGVFGDHASPLSDTSIISSMGAASNHIDHINTQLPYALFMAAVTVVFYVSAGVLTS